MKKSELLSPAGSYESAIAAIQNGCDAIYLGGMRFGARAFAQNFDEVLLDKTIKYAHAYGVKVYITVNTLIREDELEACYEYIAMLYRLHADALIVQDLGILHYVRSHYPDFEVHSSTQMHTCNASALKVLKDLGVKRVVLPRETTIEEIKSWNQLGVELEVFVHGALCVSYSGQCLMSYMVGGRSGNRGECAQSCRMPYTLCDFTGNKEYSKPAYLLSLKDLNTIAHIDELQKANVASFKIEGRMKKSEYVGHITRMYRQAMDVSSYKVSEEDLQKAKVLFHRGYTDGFMYHKKGSDLYNPERPNHIGIKLGDVQFSKKDKIRVKLVEDLHQGDGVRILLKGEDYGFKVNRIYLDGLLVNGASKGSIVDIECHKMIPANSILLKTSDILIEKEIRSSYEGLNRKVAIDMNLYAAENLPLYLTVSDGIHEVSVTSSQEIEAATKRSASEEEVIDKLSKINNTIFKVRNMDVTIDGALFIPVKVINEVRREAIDKLYELRSTTFKRSENPYKETIVSSYKRESDISVKVRSEKQLLKALEFAVASIYVEDKDLYEKYKNESKVCLCGSRVHKDAYDEVCMISEVGGISLDHFEADTSLNICNSKSAYFLYLQGAKRICASLELSQPDVRALAMHLKEKYQIEGIMQSVVYGRSEVMVSQHCPINATLLDNNKKDCRLCRNHTFALKDKFNNKYPMKNDTDCRMRLFDFKIRDEISQIKENLKANVSCRLDFSFEDEKEVEMILKRVFS